MRYLPRGATCASWRTFLCNGDSRGLSADYDGMRVEVVTEPYTAQIMI